MLSMVLFVAAIVIPASAFYLYAIGQFLREALRLRSERLASVQIVVPFPGMSGKARRRKRKLETAARYVRIFCPTPGRPSQRGAA